jgi:hypothetical protein
MNGPFGRLKGLIFRKMIKATINKASFKVDVQFKSGTLGCIVKISLLLIGILISSTVGCSAIMIETFPKAKTTHTEWVEVKSSWLATYKFQHRNVTLIIKNSTYSRHLLFLGPPLLPVFPLFRNYQAKFGGFWLDVKSWGDTTKIDLSKIRIQTSGGKSIQPNAIWMWPTDHYYGKPYEKPKEITIQQVEVSKENMTFSIKFDARESELVKYFTLDLGEIAIDDENIKVPLLQYHKGSKWTFCLLAIGSEGLIYFPR